MGAFEDELERRFGEELDLRDFGLSTRLAGREIAQNAPLMALG